MKKSVHFVGIKGVGVAPLAIIAKEAGMNVSGCDVDQEFITDEALKKAGIGVENKMTPDHITTSVNLVITTGAHGGFDNPEVKRAKSLNIPVLTQGEALGEFMKGDIFSRSFEQISVSGAHGKTTTTAMIATILKNANLDPSYLIGTSDIHSLGLPGHYGKGRYFVSEADEYATEPVHDKTPKFMWLKPKIAVVTNIEHDHPDIYPSEESMVEAFIKFTDNIDENGTLVIFGESPQTRRVAGNFKGKVVTFGYSKNNDFNVQRISIEGSKTFFWAYYKETLLGEFSIGVLGEFNCLNALAAIAACLELGLSIDKIKEGLAIYSGSKRRAEFVGELEKGALLYDDYAHHPTEIKRTLEAFRKNYTNSNIVCIFQPHTYSRTKTLFEQFTSSFTAADELIMMDIYPSLREEKDDTVSSEMLIDRISKIHKSAIFLPKADDVVKYLDEKSYGRGTIIITMGAGDVYQIKNSLKLI